MGCDISTQQHYYAHTIEFVREEEIAGENGGDKHGAIAVHQHRVQTVVELREVDGQKGGELQRGKDAT